MPPRKRGLLKAPVPKLPPGRLRLDHRPKGPGIGCPGEGLRPLPAMWVPPPHLRSTGHRMLADVRHLLSSSSRISSTDRRRRPEARATRRPPPPAGFDQGFHHLRLDPHMATDLYVGDATLEDEPATDVAHRHLQTLGRLIDVQKLRGRLSGEWDDRARCG